jgi:hypothetical protein
VTALIDRLRSEPALVTSLVSAILIALAAFGLPLSDAQTAAVTGLVIAAQAFVVRAKVTPVRNL